ncbi:hypothetical protein A3A54_02350 [Candidatus Curtissbacteria bacterium RIFCSPLOWO2_01_FULL_39_62]|uniref:Uncharacterized protein n=2 Tax=Candidatus Curtissiibacteriota TaxID=1752717 RepID=A0A1F5G8U2_9BACT|nr:MAG: hypothetical protein A2775_02750 [Candidatus Curtissbacteria bacterium RIFCSPHIGHO2_01_FULL_39_57]OGD88290.1 MAG: hypothetical protein A3D04_00725 [Candidatus Curtissbacteria bacterium RIFCSPHIGHO2_02_FULL_40_16b]OGD90354.1 MAG: hypothetical protein A3E11_00735 [Candidatus Curtissbacteria bacterium RIFCSPHIGHO2_12_FULL_38_37]OGE00078.1 MAG: hypothetical protein A3J17_05330 [Candidatus Curtissbacteria bacterium RIFCSPLOWO2_02_FULL_40_11]OGE00592.1 MAG: hypothetical protein A3A54_02350 [C
MDKYANFKQIALLDKIAVEQADLTILQMMEMAGNKFALGVKDYLLYLHDKKLLHLITRDAIHYVVNSHY